MMAESRHMNGACLQLEVTKPVPAVDVLRCVALVLVLAYHLELCSFGFLGVEIFSVLTGFLLTRQIFGVLCRLDRLTIPVPKSNEATVHSQDDPVPKLKAFYNDVIDTPDQLQFEVIHFCTRRMQRLLPELVFFTTVVCLVSILFLDSTLSPTYEDDQVRRYVVLNRQLQRLSEQAKQVFLLTFTDQLYRDSVNYFASTTDLNPILHLWFVVVQIRVTIVGVAIVSIVGITVWRIYLVISKTCATFYHRLHDLHPPEILRAASKIIDRSDIMSKGGTSKSKAQLSSRTREYDIPSDSPSLMLWGTTSVMVVVIIWSLIEFGKANSQYDERYFLTCGRLWQFAVGGFAAMMHLVIVYHFGGRASRERSLALISKAILYDESPSATTPGVNFREFSKTVPSFFGHFWEVQKVDDAHPDDARTGGVIPVCIEISESPFSTSIKKCQSHPNTIICLVFTVLLLLLTGSTCVILIYYLDNRTTFMWQLMAVSSCITSGLWIALSDTLLFCSTKGSQAKLAMMNNLKPVLVYVNPRSYSIYLWHWAVIVFYKEVIRVETTDFDDGLTKALLVIVTLVVADISYRFVSFFTGSEITNMRNWSSKKTAFWLWFAPMVFCFLYRYCIQELQWGINWLSVSQDYVFHERYSKSQKKHSILAIDSIFKKKDGCFEIVKDDFYKYNPEELFIGKTLPPRQHCRIGNVSGKTSVDMFRDDIGHCPNQVNGSVLKKERNMLLKKCLNESKNAQKDDALILGDSHAYAYVGVLHEWLYAAGKTGYVVTQPGTPFIVLPDHHQMSIPGDINSGSNGMQKNSESVMATNINLKHIYENILLRDLENDYCKVDRNQAIMEHIRINSYKFVVLGASWKMYVRWIAEYLLEYSRDDRLATLTSRSSRATSMSDVQQQMISIFSTLLRSTINFLLYHVEEIVFMEQVPTITRSPFCGLRRWDRWYRGGGMKHCASFPSKDLIVSEIFDQAIKPFTNKTSTNIVDPSRETICRTLLTTADKKQGLVLMEKSREMLCHTYLDVDLQSGGLQLTDWKDRSGGVDALVRRVKIPVYFDSNHINGVASRLIGRMYLEKHGVNPFSR